ncbi:hypothetical protein BDV97DRAFT_137636 [Delphinella strobiligena]|nr:hypothetical protein BDV97DRAFT_137636 [Delphinella strobiligena]
MKSRQLPHFYLSGSIIGHGMRRVETSNATHRISRKPHHFYEHIAKVGAILHYKLCVRNKQNLSKLQRHSNNIKMVASGRSLFSPDRILHRIVWMPCLCMWWSVDHEPRLYKYPGSSSSPQGAGIPATLPLPTRLLLLPPTNQLISHIAEKRGPRTELLHMPDYLCLYNPFISRHFHSFTSLSPIQPSIVLPGCSAAFNSNKNAWLSLSKSWARRRSPEPKDRVLYT